VYRLTGGKSVLAGRLLPQVVLRKSSPAVALVVHLPAADERESWKRLGCILSVVFEVLRDWIWRVGQDFGTEEVGPVCAIGSDRKLAKPPSGGKMSFSRGWVW
jgi:hypothetical protein